MTSRTATDDPAASRLTGIFLEGFQSVLRPTFIPIKRINLLYGPNSAGKSAVLDALLLLSDYASGRAESVCDWIERSRRWRQPAESSTHRSMAPTMKLGVEVAIGSGWQGEVQSDRSGWLESLVGRRVQIELESGFHWHEFCRIGVSVDGQRIFDYDPNDKHAPTSSLRAGGAGGPLKPGGLGPIRIYVRHPFWAGVHEAHVVKRLLSRASSLKLEDFKDLNYEVQWDNSVVDLYNWIFLDGTRAGAGWLQAGFEDDMSRDLSGVSVSQKLFGQIVAAVGQFVPQLNGFLRDLGESVRVAAKAVHVDAGRSIINAGAATHFFGYGSFHRTLSAGRSDAAPDPLRALAGALASKEGRRAAKRLRWYGGSIPGQEVVSDFVTEAMDKVLPSLRKYRLRATPYAVTQLGAAGKYATTDETTIVRLHLVSQDGSVLDFEDVGSGFSHVIPIIAALWKAELALIEQPELHLHPAAQCEMADVMLLAAHRGSRLVVESHSEHLMLRLLRRVRQTNAGTCPRRELSLRPEDISIAYFDPKDDGTTTVKLIRVARDGEFIDSWPRGFFEERGEELFGE